ncbi:uncharacterized protein BDZ99DRAFT_458452 [Mytilinidion resinicola]|uniref:Uncharacterized protein n=1 Tax=Mytilinidion resinicola TaxID=574789 RepID=A0A6A6Z676_9PEZI|nr:uncharacterized protein BDZ99DRAFT_458452 [Mytilinidion resinicola]KAF2816596.1 hypothetical protein BDZ99DRAFT_458452 [Mytilinidion resinicola]
MSKRVALLPKPLPADEVNVGQLLIHPLHPELDGFFSEKQAAAVDELNDYFIQLRYKDLFSVDTEGRFAQNFGAKFDLGQVYRKPNLLSVSAEQMIQRISKHPYAAFETVCSDPDAQAWIAELAKEEKACYIVLGITEFKNAVFKRAVLQDGGVSNRLKEQPIEKGAKVPRSVRRDSTLGLGTEAHLSGVFGMDVRRIKARISRVQEPHTVEDLKWNWIYYNLPGSPGLQLMIGLGESLKAEELRLMLDLSDEEVKGNLHVISNLSMDALQAAASPMLRPSSPALRGRSPSPNPATMRL